MQQSRSLSHVVKVEKECKITPNTSNPSFSYEGLTMI
jgi:hypothetical protein